MPKTLTDDELKSFKSLGQQRLMSWITKPVTCAISKILLAN